MLSDSVQQDMESRGESARALHHLRIINAPVPEVFSAFSTPALLARWWGPAGFTSTFQQCEFRPGGQWRFVMHGPDGKDYPNHNVFAEIVTPNRIVIDHPSTEHHFVLVIQLTEHSAAGSEQTIISWQQVFDSIEQCQAIAGFVRQANEQNLDRLAALVERLW